MFKVFLHYRKAADGFGVVVELCPEKMDRGTVVVVETAPHVPVGVCEGGGIVVDGLRCGVRRVEALHGETDEFSFPFGVIHSPLDVGVPVGGGMDVNNRECDGVPHTLGDTGVADSLYSRHVIRIAQPAEGDGVG